MPIIYGTGGFPTTSAADTSNQPFLQDKQGAIVASELHGKWYTAAYRGRLFGATATAVTIPVVTAALVSVFTLWNPPGSGINMEMVETTVGQVSATTVVNVVGWYFSTAALTAAGSFTTAGTVQNLNVGGLAGQGKFFSAYTHSGTPVLVDVIGSFGATTNATAYTPTKIYDGRLILPPGIAMSVAMGTAAGSSSGLTIAASWAEFPV